MAETETGNRDGRNAGEWYLEGTREITTGRYLEAIHAFETSLAIKPGEARCLAALGAAIDRLGFF